MTSTPRKGKKELLADLLRRSHLLPALRRVGPSRLVVFGYHRIRPDDPGFTTPFDEATYGPTVSEFEEQVVWLKDNVRVLSEADLIAATRAAEPPREPCVVLTFDDGCRDNFTLARPVLERHGVPAIYFLPSHLLEQRTVGWWDVIAYLVKRTNRPSLTFSGRTFAVADDRRLTIAALQRVMKNEPAERTGGLLGDLAAACDVALPDRAAQDAELMTWDEVRATAEGGVIAIGSHTHTHRVLSTLPLDVQRDELAESKRVLEAVTGRPVRTVAYPVGNFGHFTQETQRIAAECGYSLGFSSDHYSAGYNRWDALEPFNVRRVVVPAALEMLRATAVLPGAFARGSRLPARFVLLGSSVTALELLRHVRRLHGTAVLIDGHDGVAMRSRLAAEKHRLAPGEDAMGVVRRYAVADAADARPYLLATSDAQLGFVLQHRAELDAGFHVLHPRNDVLRTCLDKVLFHRFCEARGLPVPRSFLCRARAADVERLVRTAALPLIVRPANKSRGKTAFPKVMRLESRADVDELARLVTGLHPDDELLVSESLLPRTLVRYSVAFCAARHSFLAFESIKERPSAESGAVGTYVRLTDAPDARAVCKNLVEALGYLGMGEAEIFADARTGEHFLIELNARPWVQLGMDRLAGHDFLAFLIGRAPGPVGASHPGQAWMSLADDLYYRASRTAREAGHAGIDLDYLRSLGRARAFPYFALGDPMPAAAEAAGWVGRMAARRFGGDAAPPGLGPEADDAAPAAGTRGPADTAGTAPGVFPSG